MAEPFGWSDQVNCRSRQFGRRSAGSLGMPGASVCRERRHPAGLV